MNEHQIGHIAMLLGAANFDFNFAYEYRRDQITDARLERIEAKLDWIIERMAKEDEGKHGGNDEATDNGLK